MNYQDKFLTIWDAPVTSAAQEKAKQSVQQRANRPQSSALKEAFLTIWDSTKSKTAS
ncbi:MULTISPECIES: hypothetical protein [Halomonadaceae]|jgi:hypothetical protein|uniref:hypothetical protein n=1 Tax=Halomonadaceae TaxID=28256 RepID=UPI0014449EA8|nr:MULTISPECIES: hypothetical protein [Halomonas]MCG7576665.1 hypothetical protein [Halomonas sp. MMH1-48]MCG7590847.1 hypothetical protein [Halomonas sp. McD50-5]MCG7603728.1 hypothetical protein [Halomonas sp. MM17-34]MCG7612978.1 hypothetical protein [Halomonas sp. MM17-29]MCG7616959.1 hypothetical protein [Halomonas sp. McD50-4]|tara:strand:+ start:1614 stop:1784 length:171 start_codon:yes stop_codon:yes gene_type:complete